MAGDLALNKRQGKKADCLCRECHRITKHEIIVEATLSGSSGPAQFEVNWTVEHQIIRCLGCETFSFRKASGSDEDIIQVGEGEWEYQPTVEVYPTPIEGRQPLTDDGLLPDKIQRVYEESLKALNAEQPVLCGIGIRAIIETVCKDKAATGGDLYSKINSLVGLGVLTQDGADILHKLRTLGNNAAHEVKPHSLKELGLAFDVVEHLATWRLHTARARKKDFQMSTNSASLSDSEPHSIKWTPRPNARHVQLAARVSIDAKGQRRVRA